VNGCVVLQAVAAAKIIVFVFAHGFKNAMYAILKPTGTSSFQISVSETFTFTSPGSSTRTKLTRTTTRFAITRSKG
jgi:hypothetical protein